MDTFTIQQPKPKKRGRKKFRGEDGRIPIALGPYIDAIVRGVPGKTRPRTLRWIAQQLGMGTDGDAVGQWRRQRTRPLLPQALGLHYLFGVPLEAMLTTEERVMLASTVLEGKRIALEPAPNPRDYTRKKTKADARQVTLEEVLHMKGASVAAAPRALDTQEPGPGQARPTNGAAGELDWIEVEA